MLHRSLLVITAASFLGAAEPRWRPPGACIAPTGTPCRTLVYEISGWTNRAWGLFAIERYHERVTEALRRDGAALLRISHQSHQFYFIPDEQYDRTRLVFPSRQQTFEVEHTLKAVREMGGIWPFSEWWTDESDCSNRALNAGEGPRRTGRELSFAGHTGIEYEYVNGDQRVVQRIAFAPSLGCTAVQFTLSERNAAGLPVSEYQLKLASASLDEPDPALFTIPSDYRLAGPEEPWPYVRMGKFPADITSTIFSPPVL